MIFAIAALVCFIVALIERTLGPIDMAVLGLAFVAAHLCYPVGVPARRV